MAVSSYFVKKHLAIVFWNLGIGGVQTRVTDIVSYLLKTDQNTQITLILFEKTSQDMELHQHPRLSVLVFPGPVVIKAFNRKKRVWRGTTLQFFLWLSAQLLRIKPTHVLTFLNRLSLCVALFVIGKKLFTSQAPMFIINEPVLVSRYLALQDSHWWGGLSTLSYWGANKILVATEKVKRDLVDVFGVNENKIIVVKSWIKIDETR